MISLMENILIMLRPELCAVVAVSMLAAEPIRHQQGVRG